MHKQGIQYIKSNVNKPLHKHPTYQCTLSDLSFKNDLTECMYNFNTMYSKYITYFWLKQTLIYSLQRPWPNNLLMHSYFVEIIKIPLCATLIVNVLTKSHQEWISTTAGAQYKHLIIVRHSMYSRKNTVISLAKTFSLFCYLEHFIITRLCLNRKLLSVTINFTENLLQKKRNCTLKPFHWEQQKPIFSFKKIWNRPINEIKIHMKCE